MRMWVGMDDYLTISLLAIMSRDLEFCVSSVS